MTIEDIQKFGEEIKKFKTEPTKAYLLRDELYYNFLVYISENSSGTLKEKTDKILEITNINWMRYE